ncbi:NIPSNAP family protein [Flavobacterium hydatis]|uniref:NIPSNAP family protein n=1 Tax=Flavobacterium hydatis TaxID=991 RepID=UPI0009E0721E|nr:NIPSNAP family protein [Flavobacterium hydatis]
MKLLLLTLLLITTSVVKCQNTVAVSTITGKVPPIYELRIYEIFENNKKNFHDRFRDQAMLIMKKYNFKISSIWESKSDKKTEFVYLLEWNDEATMKKAWEQFRADKEWIEIKKQTSAKFGDLIGSIEDRVLTKMDYSPY